MTRVKAHPDYVGNLGKTRGRLPDNLSRVPKDEDHILKDSTKVYVPDPEGQYLIDDKRYRIDYEKTSGRSARSTYRGSHHRKTNTD